MVDVIITCQSRHNIIFHRFRVYANTRPTGFIRWPKKLHPAICSKLINKLISWHGLTGILMFILIRPPLHVIDESIIRPATQPDTVIYIDFD